MKSRKITIKGYVGIVMDEDGENIAPLAISDSAGQAPGRDLFVDGRMYDGLPLWGWIRA